MRDKIVKIYLDVCCLNRPFDDQTQDRIHFESEAVLIILNRCQIGRWWLISSDVVDFEISRTPDSERRQKVIILTALSKSKIIIDTEIEERAVELEALGFKPFDALHIACAEKSNADILLTTDDSLLYKALRNINRLKVKIENPVKWLMEVIRNESANDGY